MDSSQVIDCEEISSQTLDEMAYELAIENANSYGDFYDMETYEELSSEGKVDDTCFCDNDLEYSWQVYEPELHDSKRAGGGSFLEEFPS